MSRTKFITKTDRRTGKKRRIPIRRKSGLPKGVRREMTVDGVKYRIVSSAEIAGCPHHRLDPAHYIPHHHTEDD